MRIFITGGTGFIGPYVVKKLTEKGHSLLLLNNQNVDEIADVLKLAGSPKLLVGDLSNISEWKEMLSQFHPDAALHMAWEGIPDYKAKASIKNLQYGLNFYLTLADIGCKKILTTGTCWEYGEMHGELSEDMQLNPFNPFSSAKNALYIMGEEISKEHKMQFIWTRLFFVYGPRQKQTSLIPYIINCILEKKTPQIKALFSKNDFIHVEDVATALVMLLEKEIKNSIFNIGSGYSISVREIIEKVYELCQLQLPNEIANQSQQDWSDIDFWANISRIKSEIGWKTKYSIEDGIKTVLKYYKLI